MRASVALGVLAMVLVGASASAQPLQSIFERANTAASQGAYDEAIRDYLALIGAGTQDPDVHYNLATAWAQRGDYPRAIWQFEKALRLRPNDEQAARDLDTARRLLALQRTEAEGQADIRPPRPAPEAVFQRWSEDTLARVVLGANAVFFVALALWTTRRGRRRGARAAGLLAATAATVLIIGATGLAVKSGTFRQGDPAILLGDPVPLLEGPDPRARVRATGRGGDRAEILDREGNFVEVVIPGVSRGWAESRHIGPI